MCLKPDSSPLNGTLGNLLDRALRMDQQPTASATEGTVAATDTPPPSRVARAKLWTLDKKYHCLIIGTCIDVGELSKIARRFGFNARANDHYARHVEAVGWCGARNQVAETMQRGLDKRYAAALKAFAADRDERAVLARWNDCLERGEVAGPLWAAITHKHAGQAVRHAVYAAVHMLSHQVGAGLAADVRRLDFLEQDNVRLRLELAGAKAALNQRAELSADEHRSMTGEIAELRAANAKLRADRERLERLENGVTMVEMGRKLLALATENRTLHSAAARADGLAARNDRLQSEAEAARAAGESLRQERSALERLLLDAAEAAGASSECSDTESDANRAGTGDCLRCAEKMVFRAPAAFSASVAAPRCSATTGHSPNGSASG